MIRVIIVGVVFMLWAVWARSYYVCEILGECQPPLTDVDSSYLDNIPNTLTLQAGEHVLLQDYPEFYFDYGSHGYTYINGNEKYLAKLAAFMAEHPETKLIVTGFYTQEEKEVVEKSHFYNDLGKARAYTIVNKLIEEYKLPKHRLKGISKLSDTNPIVTPLRFEILGYTPPEIAAMNEEDTLFLEQVQQSILDITYNDKNAKFEYNSEKFQPSASFDIYLDSLQAYFEVNPTAYMMIIGHTDSKGTSSYNQKLGKGRAESVKAYLEAAGIEVNIETASKGESDPIIKDTNDDGSYNIDAMAQNRRVNILVKTE